MERKYEVLGRRYRAPESTSHPKQILERGAQFTNEGPLPLEDVLIQSATLKIVGKPVKLACPACTADENVAKTKVPKFDDHAGLTAHYAEAHPALATPAGEEVI